MNQISIGDSTGYTNISGASPYAGFRLAECIFSFSFQEKVKEKIEIELKGTYAQISTAFRILEKVKLRSIGFSLGEYAHPQTLRFQPNSGGAYYYAQISDLYLEAHTQGYLTHTQGSFRVTLHYTRPNHFDGAQSELPLTGEPGADITGGMNLINKADGTGALSSIARIKAADADADLPSPTRIILTDTNAGGFIKDIFIGNFHHPTNTDQHLFYKNVDGWTGGTQADDAGAIDGKYRWRTWTSAAWTNLFSTGIAYPYVNLLGGHTFRPIIHFFEKHAYTDLYFKIKLSGQTYIIKDCEPAWSDPNYQYIILPPIQIPPNQVLHEKDPDDLFIDIYCLKTDGTAATIKLDQIFFFPTDYAADFKAFYIMSQDDYFIDDSYLKRTNVNYFHPASGGAEIVGHNRIGSPLLLYPNENNFFICFHSNNSHQIDITRTSKIQMFYRPRISIL